MAWFNIFGSGNGQQDNPSLTSTSLGTSLQQLLLCDDIEPGSDPGYETCKVIWLYHPLGAKMVETPIKMAQFQPRKITVDSAAQNELREAFEKQWIKDSFDVTIRNYGTQARVYGIASVALVGKDQDPAKPLDLKKLATAEIAFNILDPLNTAGSLVLNQNPNAVDFQKHTDLTVQGVTYHRSRTLTLMNEQPIYIAWTASAYGFTGRSVFQRALFPLKSYVQTMIANDMVSRKVGLLVAILKQGAGLVDMVMQAGARFKRMILQQGQTGNVITIGEGEDIKSVDLNNVDGPLQVSRQNIIEDIASAGDMPAIILKHESFAEGFGEGTQDAYAVANYIDGIRTWLNKSYEFFDMVCQRRAWNEDFFNTIKEKYPEEYKDMDYDEAFYSWKNGYKAEWPSLIREPESEEVRREQIKIQGALAIAQFNIQLLDPENKARSLQWLEDTINTMEKMFPVPLTLDYDALRDFMNQQQEQQEQMQAVQMQGPGGEGVASPQEARPLGDSASPVAAYLAGSKDAGDPDLRSRIEHIERFIRKKRLG